MPSGRVYPFGLFGAPRAVRLALTAILAFLQLLLLSGCDRGELSQDTPEATISTARILVEKGRADQLHRLIYPESPEMTEFLRKLGVLLGNAQRLASTVQKAFPKEIEDAKSRAAQAVGSGKASALIAGFAQQAGGRRRRGGQPDFAEEAKRRRVFEDTLAGFFSDPYSMLREGEKRLSSKPLTDDTVSLRWDEQPIFPPVGVQMKMDSSGKWYFKLPTGLPGLSNYLPKSAREWRVIEYAVVVVNNTLVDLRKDIEAKRITSIDQLSRSAAEKTFPPMLMIFAAYQKALEERKKEK